MYHGALAPNSSIRKSVIATAEPCASIIKQINEAEEKMFADEKEQESKFRQSVK